MTEPREQVLQAVYAAEQAGDKDVALQGLSKKAQRLAFGVWERRDELDQALSAVSDRWRVERMPVVDRNVLRLALYELRHEPNTPTAVIISEAVELAKQYSTDKSGAFVNGVLGRLAKEVRGE